MNENRNKFLAIAITLLFVSALTAGAYFFFFQKSDTPSDSSSQQTNQPKLNKISEDSVISPILNKDGNAVWYFNSKGQMFRRALDGSQLDEFTLPSLISNFRHALWSNDGSDVILVSGDQPNEQKNFLDIGANQYKLLPQNVQGFDWMPDGQRILYIWKSGDTQQLVIANPDTSGFRTIREVFWPDLDLKVSPDGKNVLLLRNPGEDLNKIYMADVESGTFRTVVNEGKNLEVEWVSNTNFLYTQGVGSETKVQLFDLDTMQTQDLEMNSTLDKVAVDTAGKYLYAAALEKTSPQYSLYKMDLTSLQKETVYKFDSSVIPKELLLAGQKIIFANALDGKLYSITQ